MKQDEVIRKAIKRLEILRKAELEDSIRSAKAIEVGLRLIAPLLVTGLRNKYKSDQEIADALTTVDLKITHDKISRCRIGKHTPDIETVYRLYREYDRVSTTLRRARLIETPLIEE